jgi:hypothetical protein
MNGEDKFWVVVTAIVGAVATVLVLTIASSSWRSDKIILEMVEAGADPIAASCAINDTQGNSPTCIAIAARTNVKGQRK